MCIRDSMYGTHGMATHNSSLYKIGSALQKIRSNNAVREVLGWGNFLQNDKQEIGKGKKTKKENRKFPI